jgi:hypothetical protein
MLISHLHRFIYMKTLKTGGTSVEIYFERYCTDPAKEFQALHERDSETSKWGVIGARGDRFVPGRTWYNHMPAGRVRALIGPELWNSYYKFCVVRNPYDKIVSHFWHGLPPEKRLHLASADFDEVRRQFQQWLTTADHPMDRTTFTISGLPVMNRYVRYEDLHAGLEDVCKNLGLPWEPSLLGRFKSDKRLRNEPYAKYYDRSSADLVGSLYQWEMQYFHYGAL